MTILRKWNNVIGVEQVNVVDINAYLFYIVVNAELYGTHWISLSIRKQLLNSKSKSSFLNSGRRFVNDMQKTRFVKIKTEDLIFEYLYML